MKEKKVWHKGSLGDEDDVRTFEHRHSAQKAHDTTQDNENGL